MQFLLYHTIDVPAKCVLFLRSSDLCWSDSLNLVHHECLGVQTLLTANDKWQWAVAEVAQFCVENRLKTPFGKPLETFLQFESAH
jgi:hypothetical protein